MKGSSPANEDHNNSSQCQSPQQEEAVPSVKPKLEDFLRCFEGQVIQFNNTYKKSKQ